MEGDIPDMEYLRNGMPPESTALHGRGALEGLTTRLKKRSPPLGAPPLIFAKLLGISLKDVGLGQSAYGGAGSLLGTVGLKSGIGVAAIAQTGMPCKVVANIIVQNWQVQVSALQDLIITATGSEDLYQLAGQYFPKRRVPTKRSPKANREGYQGYVQPNQWKWRYLCQRYVRVQSEWW